jgi:cytochrome oxidase Cu insertion factor (SCO1/SenC/PrrC family)
MAGSRARALVVIASLFCSGLTAAEEQPSAAQMMDDLMYGRGTVGGPFTLTDQTGRQRSDTDFRGRLMIVYFGYTYCPDVCPTDLMAITQALDTLGPAAEGVQPIYSSPSIRSGTARCWRTISLPSIAA